MKQSKMNNQLSNKLGHKKFVLTASLLAVLATQYSFQTSTLNLEKSIAMNHYQTSGEFSFASTAPLAPIAKPQASDELKNILKNEKNDNVATEATSSADCPSGECKTQVSEFTTIKTEDYTKLLLRIEALEKIQTTVVQAPVVTEEVIVETRAEKRERLKDEKIEKENEKQALRIEKFEDKMESIKDKCDQDLTCLSTEFTSVLSRYQGKNSVPNGIVSKYYTSVVGTALNKAMYSDDQDTLSNSLSAIQSLLQDMPEQYKGLKKSVIDAVKNQSVVAANKVSVNYARLNTLSKENNPTAYFETLRTTQADHQNLSYQANSYSSSIEESLRTADDVSMFSYYQKSYVPDMQKIMSGVINAKPEIKTIDNTNNTRDSRSNSIQPKAVTTLAPELTQTTTTDKMTLDMTTLAPIENYGFEAGPAADSTRGGRGPK